MPNYTQGDTRPVLDLADVAPYQKGGSVVLDSRRTRPLWFDGRFLAARDLAREQNYFLLREADLARSPGFRTISGLLVAMPNTRSIAIQPGQGVTPSGELVTVPKRITLELAALAMDENLDVRFGISPVIEDNPNTRSGLFIIALRPVQFAANQIVAFPTTVQGPRTAHEGDLVEGTAVVLVPWPGP